MTNLKTSSSKNWKCYLVSFVAATAALLFSCEKQSNLTALQSLPLEWDFEMSQNDGYKTYIPWTPQSSVNFNADGSLKTMEEIKVAIAKEKGYQPGEVRLVSPETMDYYLPITTIDRAHTYNHPFYDLSWGKFRNGEPILKGKLLQQNYKQLIVNNENKEKIKIIGGRAIIVSPKDTVSIDPEFPILPHEKYRTNMTDILENGYLTNDFLDDVWAAKRGDFVYISGVVIEQNGRKFVMPAQYKFVIE